MTVFGPIEDFDITHLAVGAVDNPFDIIDIMDDTIRVFRTAGRIAVFGNQLDFNGFNTIFRTCGSGIFTVLGPTHPADIFDMGPVIHIVNAFRRIGEFNLNGLDLASLTGGASHVSGGCPILPILFVYITSILNLIRHQKT